MSAQHDCQSAAAAVPPRQGQTVLWIIAILLAIIATTLVTQNSGNIGIKPAFADAPMVGARGIFAFTGQIDKSSYGLFMMDVDNNTVWCYQYVPGTRKLRLVAARSFLYDRYLENHSCDEPSPNQVRDMLEDQRKIRSRIDRGGIAPDDAEEILEASVPGFSG